jgi:flagellar motor switch protein FliN/FliY
MSEILSQDQIDGLIGKMAVSGSIPGEDEGTKPSAEKDYQLLTNAINLFCEQASIVVSTLLNKDVSFSVKNCQKADKTILFKDKQENVLLISIKFKSGLEKGLYCIIDKNTVALLCDLMMMGDGSSSYSEDHKDAISELFSQILGSYTTALGQKINEQISTDKIEALNCYYDNLPFSPEQADMCLININIAAFGAKEFIIVLPQESSEYLCAKFKNIKTETEEIKETKVGLNQSELQDLADVTSTDKLAEPIFTETPITSQSIKTSAPKENIDMLLDIELDVTIELGKANLSIKRILEMGPGSIIELDKMAGEPVDLLVNNKVVAKGEVVVVDENFGIRIVSLVSPEERIRSLR